MEATSCLTDTRISWGRWWNSTSPNGGLIGSIGEVSGVGVLFNGLSVCVCVVSGADVSFIVSLPSLPLASFPVLYKRKKTLYSCHCIPSSDWLIVFLI